MANPRTRAYRLEDHTLEHLEFAHESSGLSRTIIVRRALNEYLEKHFPIPESATAAAKAPYNIC